MRTLDWLDKEGHVTSFWPDAEVDYGFFTGSGEGWVCSVMPVEMSATRRWYSSGGILIEIWGNTARSECYYRVAKVGFAMQVEGFFAAG